MTDSHASTAGEAPRLPPKRIKIWDIQKAVARQYHLPPFDLLSQSRVAPIALPRQVAMYLARTLTRRSFQEISGHFGGREHATAFHAVRKIGWLIGERSGKPPRLLANPHSVPVDHALAEEIEVLKRQLQE